MWHVACSTMSEEPDAELDKINLIAWPKMSSFGLMIKMIKLQIRHTYFICQVFGFLLTTQNQELCTLNFEAHIVSLPSSQIGYVSSFSCLPFHPFISYIYQTFSVILLLQCDPCILSMLSFWRNVKNCVLFLFNVALIHISFSNFWCTTLEKFYFSWKYSWNIEKWSQVCGKFRVRAPLAVIT